MKLLKRALLPVLIFSIALTGCGASADYGSLTLNKKGVLTQVIVEEWDQERYDKKELQEQIETEIQEYGGSIELNSVKTTDTSVNVEMTYQNPDVYAQYNQVTMFRGTVAECQAAGYLLQGEFKDTQGEAVDRTQVLNMGDSCTVLVFQEPVSVRVPGKILCCSNTLEIVSKKEVKASLEEGSTDILLADPVYVIYK